MREIYKQAIKDVISESFYKTRTEQRLTQDKMSEKLMLSCRSYIDIEHGASLCGSLPLILYLLDCCQDPMEFLDEMRIALDKLR